MYSYIVNLLVVDKICDKIAGVDAKKNPFILFC
jgi:hypothetical protein